VRIRWTKGARQNLEHIEEYIAQDNPKAAIDAVLKVITTVGLLVEHPAMGRHGRVVGTRELVIANTPYIVPYRVKEGCIEILRVLHSAMQWPECFQH
jgi:toxin ParE1/3/4